ncbi:MAG: hypothetical protein GC151_10080 [Betaproteobacteria bacterium]|nr:hypothetical protein [Betaproteobacteria bacterium]
MKLSLLATSTVAALLASSAAFATPTAQPAEFGRDGVPHVVSVAGTGFVSANSQAFGREAPMTRGASTLNTVRGYARLDYVDAPFGRS